VLVRLVVLLAVLSLLYLLVRWFIRTPPEKVRAAVGRFALWTLVGTLVALAVTGRLHWLFAALAALVPLAQRLLTLLQLAPAVQRLVRRFRGSPGAGPGGQTGHSTLETRYLRMVLDHESGALTGLVLAGAYRGRPLDGLSLAELLDLLAVCQAEDRQSAAVLEAYLDRAHGPAWREARPEPPGTPAGPEGRMTREQAFQILGLAPGATEEAIRTSHRRLMQKLHPDRGGSDYLAALLNQAKDLLLGRGP
jgi:hypothetical protein